MDKETDNRKPLAIFYAYDQEMVELYSHMIGYLRVLDNIKDALRNYDEYGNSFDNASEAIEKIRKDLLDDCAENHLPPYS